MYPVRALLFAALIGCCVSLPAVPVMTGFSDGSTKPIAGAQQSQISELFNDNIADPIVSLVEASSSSSSKTMRVVVPAVVVGLLALLMSIAFFVHRRHVYESETKLSYHPLGLKEGSRTPREHQTRTLKQPDPSTEPELALESESTAESTGGLVRVVSAIYHGPEVDLAEDQFLRNLHLAKEVDRAQQDPTHQDAAAAVPQTPHTKRASLWNIARSMVQKMAFAPEDTDPQLETTHSAQEPHLKDVVQLRLDANKSVEYGDALIDPKPQQPPPPSPAFKHVKLRHIDAPKLSTSSQGEE